MTMRLLVCTLCVFGPKNFGIGCCDSLLLQSPPFDPMAELTTVIPTLPMPRRLGWTRSAWTVENILTTTPRSLNKLFIFSLLSHHEWNISNRSFTTTKTLICSGWETPVIPISQPETPVRDKRGCPFVPGLATGTEEDLLSRLVTPTGTKGAASAHVAGAPFCPGWCYQPGQKVSFFFMFFFSQFFFYFNYTFAFQLNLCIEFSVYDLH